MNKSLENPFKIKSFSIKETINNNAMPEFNNIEILNKINTHGMY